MTRTCRAACKLWHVLADDEYLQLAHALTIGMYRRMRRFLQFGMYWRIRHVPEDGHAAGIPAWARGRIPRVIPVSPGVRHHSGSERLRSVSPRCDAMSAWLEDAPSRQGSPLAARPAMALHPLMRGASSAGSAPVSTPSVPTGPRWPAS